MGSKSSKVYKGEESAPATTNLSVDFTPVSSKSYKPAGKTHKVAVEEAHEPSTTKKSTSTNLSTEFIVSSKSSKPVTQEPEPIIDDMASKSSKSSLPIAPRSITFETDSQVSEANKANEADASGVNARKMSAVSMAAVGVVLFM